MLKPEEENDAPVLREDQDKINRFACLNSRVADIQAKFEDKKSYLEVLADASDEVTLADEDGIKFRFGDGFCDVGSDEAEEMVTAVIEATTAERDQLEDQLAGIRAEMADLKAQLYAKFGQSINLES
eukprot:m.26266 g.26266  ORF g.26266 m.26266 type:complete len:127 (+) comp8166_c0_seq1:1735-2115(+)